MLTHGPHDELELGVGNPELNPPEAPDPEPPAPVRLSLSGPPKGGTEMLAEAVGKAGALRLADPVGKPEGVPVAFLSRQVSTQSDTRSRTTHVETTEENDTDVVLVLDVMFVLGIAGGPPVVL